MNKDTIPFKAVALALLPLVFLVGLLGYNAWVWGDDVLGGANQTALLLAGALAALLGISQKTSWDAIQSAVTKSVSAVVPSILILLLIGALAGTWLLSGIIPALIYWGLDFIHPAVFLPATCVVCAIVSVATGSSWSTIATVGVVFLGIGKAFGLPPGWIGGAIISGAYFGDKISLLSDTTNLAASIAEVDIFRHIRFMLQTTVPSFVITLAIFSIMGINHTQTTSPGQIAAIQEGITSLFQVHIGVLVVPVTVGILIWRKWPALPVIFMAVILAGLAAPILQPEIFQLLTATYDAMESSYAVVMQAIFGDLAIPTENKQLQSLLSAGGMGGMLGTIWLIISAMVFGGVMEACGFLRVITLCLLRFAQSTWRLIGTTSFTCLFFNLTASDQYLSITIPGSMFREAFQKQHLKKEALGRTLEDSATVTSVLVPWNTCGATQAAVLGVPTLMYAPFCFFNWISPIMTILFGIFAPNLLKQQEDDAVNS